MEYFHVITDSQTGEVTTIPFTQEEVLAHEAASLSNEVVISPVEKLKHFLSENPDVAALLGNQCLG